MLRKTLEKDILANSVYLTSQDPCKETNKPMHPVKYEAPVKEKLVHVFKPNQNKGK